MTENLSLWNKLGKTDPSHTKSFKRAGGFGGTAIKPIYTEQKMTEEFGPCGTGWGFSEPVFQTVPASEGQIAVYCWLSLWYVLDGKRSEPVFGVGGDMVVVKQSSGLRTDDEAFKKAFTDAIGNAMKHVGMSADVHMGLFDDSKYVSDVRNEIDAEKSANKSTDARAIFTKHEAALRAATTPEGLKAAWAAAMADKGKLTMDWQKALVAERDAKIEQLKPKTGTAVPPNFDNLDKSPSGERHPGEYLNA